MLYRYQAIDGSGSPASGTTEAGSPADARALLRERGLLAYKVEETKPANQPGRAGRRGGVSWLNLSGRRLEALTESTRHLALLLRTGVPLAQGLAVLAGQTTYGRFRESIEEIASRVKEGVAFDLALASHPRFFPDLYVHVARAGIQAGELPKVLVELAAYYAGQKRIRDRVVSALTYPALMCTVGLLVLGFLLGFVVPKVTSILLEQERVLPWPTEALLWTSNAVTTFWWALLGGALILFLGFRRFAATEGGGKLLDRCVLKVPILGNLIRKQIVARWSGTMSTLLASGIPVAQALSVVREAVGNKALTADVARVEAEVLEGSSLSEALKRSQVLPRSIGFVAGVGEETGGLAEVLREVTESYNEEVEVAAARLTDLLNPILIVFLGVVVGFIVAAILLPITDFTQVR